MLEGKQKMFVKSSNIPDSPHERACTEFYLFPYPTVYSISSKMKGLKLSFLMFLDLKIN